MRVLADGIEQLEPWNSASLEDAFRAILGREEATLKDVALACRIAVTGRKAGPGLFEILSVIGPTLTASRLRGDAGEPRA
jgi:glutamyl-tRNA synthetase